MTFAEAVAELQAKYPSAALSPAVMRGECGAAGIDFKKGKGGVYAGRGAAGPEVLVYYNDTERRICCTEIGHEDDDG